VRVLRHRFNDCKNRNGMEHKLQTVIEDLDLPNPVITGTALPSSTFATTDC
jgi:hypothetical protein